MDITGLYLHIDKDHNNMVAIFLWWHAQGGELTLPFDAHLGHIYLRLEVKHTGCNQCMTVICDSRTFIRLATRVTSSMMLTQRLSFPPWAWHQRKISLPCEYCLFLPHSRQNQGSYTFSFTFQLSILFQNQHHGKQRMHLPIVAIQSTVLLRTLGSLHCQTSLLSGISRSK